MAITVGPYERSSDAEKEEARGVANRAADDEALAELLAGRFASTPGTTTSPRSRTDLDGGTD